jgi:hypothetical protein
VVIKRQRKRRASRAHLFYGQPLDLELATALSGDRATLPTEPDGAQRRSTTGVRRATPIPPERWPLVAADARWMGLWQAARRHEVSHETVRRIMRRLAGAEDRFGHPGRSDSSASA